MSKTAIQLLAVVLALLAAAAAGAAGAAELKVLSTEAMRPILQELAPAFEARLKNKLHRVRERRRRRARRSRSDESIDIAILTKALWTSW